MKIAAAYENGQIFQHFGHTEAFKVYEVQDKKSFHQQSFQLMALVTELWHPFSRISEQML